MENMCYSSKTRTQNFKHTLEIKFFVKTKKLWENARSYIWRHFGQHEWENKDGTKLTVNRINMKAYYMIFFSSVTSTLPLLLEIKGEEIYFISLY